MNSSPPSVGHRLVCLVAFGLVVLSTTLLLQVLETRKTMLVVLLLWLLPLLVTAVVSAAVEDFLRPQAMIASLSPLGLVLMSGLIPQFQPENGGPAFTAVSTGVYTGLVFVLIQVVWLWARWRKLKGTYNLACRSTAVE